MAAWEVMDEAKGRRMIDVLYFPTLSEIPLPPSQAVVRMLTQSVYGLTSTQVRCVVRN